MTNPGHVVYYVRDLKSHYDRITDPGYDIDGLSDHTVSQSIYLHGPGGKEVELYVDNNAYDWNNDNSWMEAPVRPLDPGRPCSLCR